MIDALPKEIDLGLQINEIASFEIKTTIIAAVAGFARAVFSVADASARGTHNVEKRILFAIDAYFEKFKFLARGLPFFPKFVTRRAPEDGFSCLDRPTKRRFVDVGDEDDRARIGILDGNGKDVGAFPCRARQLREVQLEGRAFFDFFQETTPFVRGHNINMKMRDPVYRSILCAAGLST